MCNPVATTGWVRYTRDVTNNQHSDDIVMRQIQPDEFSHAFTFISDVFFETWRAEELEEERELLDLERTILLVDD